MLGCMTKDEYIHSCNEQYDQIPDLEIHPPIIIKDSLLDAKYRPPFTTDYESNNDALMAIYNKYQKGKWDIEV